MLFGLTFAINAPQITSAEWISSGQRSREAPLYRPLELRVGVSGDYQNPFDPSDASLDALITLPNGKTVVVPGFQYQAYTRSLGAGKRPIAYASTKSVAEGKSSKEESFTEGEILTRSGQPQWRIRFSPWLAGVHKVQVVWKTKQGSDKSPAPSFTAVSAQGGFVKVSSKDRRYFTLSDGSPYWPIGSNICWGNARGSFDFDDWIPAFTSNGANWGRLWLGPGWTTFALQSASTDLGEYDQGNAWRIDHVLSLAERHGMKLSLCIDSYNTLKDLSSWPEWERSTLNKANGGPLAKPTDFWTSPEAERRLKDRLRYIIARFGASPSVMSWELWNEVDGVSGYPRKEIREWHARIAKMIKEMDPYGHLVTTSFGGHGASAGDAEVFALDDIDFSQTHSYEAPDLAYAVDQSHLRLAGLGKPHFIGEVGIDTGGPREELDSTGRQVHDPAWAALVAGDGGSAMPWWWDSYIAPKKHYRWWLPLSEFVKGVNFEEEGFVRTSAKVIDVNPPKVPRPRKDIVLPVGPPSFSPGPANRPQEIVITREGIQETPVLSPLLQGKGNHPELHNPITLATNLPWGVTLEIEVGDVSGYGGGALRVSIDGELRNETVIADPDGDKSGETIRKPFKHSEVIPEGSHRIVISNPGQDWLTATIRLMGALEQSGPPLVASGLVGKKTGLFWVRLEGLGWKNQIVPSEPATYLEIPGLKGEWEAEIWNTWTGSKLERQAVREGRVVLPATSSDWAVKLFRKP